MSYSGFTERLCLRGHYWTGDAWADDQLRCQLCEASVRYTHGVDQTNGYDESHPSSCYAPKVGIGQEDVWCVDPYLNRYATIRYLYAPAGDGIWIMVNSLGQATPPYPDDLEECAASADTLPKGQDAQQGLAGTESGAVPKADAQTVSPTNTSGEM